MQESSLYRFMPQVGIQNLNIKKLNSNFSLLAADVIEFSFGSSIGEGEAIMKYIPANIMIIGCYVGCMQRCTFSFRLKGCEKASMPDLADIANNGYFSVNNAYYSESTVFNDIILSADSWLCCVVENYTAGNNFTVSVICKII